MKKPPVKIPARIVQRNGALYAEPHAIRRRVDWRTLCRRFGTVLSIGGAAIAVSTPAAGGVVFGLGVLLLLAAVAAIAKAKGK